MRKIFLQIVLLIAVVYGVLSLAALAKERPPIDFSDRPLKLWVPYDPKKPGDIYSLKQDHIFIDFKDLEEIDDAKNPTKTKSDDPPVNYQLSSATYYASVKGDYINISGVYNIEKLDDEWTLIPIISDQVGLSSSSLNDKPAFMTTFRTGQDLSKFKNASRVSSGYYFLALKDEGIHKLKIDFSVKISKDPSVNTKSFSFSLPGVPIVSLHCTVNQKNLEFHVPQATSTAAKNVQDGTKLFASFPPVTNIEVKWNPKSTISRVTEDKKSTLPPSINATSYSKIEVGKKTLKGTLTFDIDIRHAALDHFDFYIPEGVEIDAVNATGNIELVDPSPQPVKGILPVDLTSAVEGNLRLIIKFRRTFDTPSFVAKIPAITLADNMKIDREVGYVGVVETTNIESTILEADQSKSFQEIDSAEFTGPLSGTRASIAFKYQKNKDKAKEFPYDIKINVVRHQGVAVYQATIKSTQIDSVINEDGQVFTKATFQVTNTRKQFLKVTLPKGSEIWSVFVDNKSVKPALKDEQKNEYSIPLAKSSDEGGKSFPVEIVYFTNTKNLLPYWLVGGMKLEALTPELASDSLKWKIFYPQKALFWPVALLSNLQEDKTYSTTRRRSNVFTNTLDKIVPADGLVQQTETFAPMKNAEINKELYPEEEVSKEELNEYDARDEEKLMLVEKKKMQPSSQVDMPVSDSNGQWHRQKAPNMYSPRQQMLFRSKKAGKLPVYIDLPEIGTSYNFYQISFQGDEEPHIFTFYSNKHFFDYLILALLVILGVYISKPAGRKEFKTPQFILPTVIFAVLLFTLIGFGWIFLLILLAALYGLYKFCCWVYSLQNPLRNRMLTAIAIVLAVILVLFVSIFIDFICGGILFVILMFAGLITGLVWLIKNQKVSMPFRKKSGGDETQDEAAGVEADREGQDNE